LDRYGLPDGRREPFLKPLGARDGSIESVGLGDKLVVQLLELEAKGFAGRPFVIIPEGDIPVLAVSGISPVEESEKYTQSEYR